MSDPSPAGEAKRAAEVAATITTVEELRERAYVIEAEAAERYTELAEQMELHNNPKAAEIFARMAEIENLHADRMRPKDHVDRPPWEYKWLTFESPEATAGDDVHYLMSPYQALEVALLNEQRAEIFYRAVAEHAAAKEVRALAAQMAEEERQHVELVRQWMAKFPPPADDWDDDPDAPNAPD
jgi:rubrerythrin